MQSFLIELLPILLFAGVSAGLLAGLFGVGGGLVIVPAVYFLLVHQSMSVEAAMAVAVATSLASIIPTSISSMWAHHKLGHVDWTIVQQWAVPMVMGVMIGSIVITIVQSKAFVVFFAVLLMAIAINKLFGARFIRPLKQRPKPIVQWGSAFSIGCISAIAGVGGGATGVPTLILFGSSIHKAVGTCAALGLCVALPSTVLLYLFSETPEYALQGTYHLHYLPALCVITPLTVLFAPVGAKLGAKLTATRLTQLFTVVLCLVSIKMFISVF